MGILPLLQLLPMRCDTNCEHSIIAKFPQGTLRNADSTLLNEFLSDLRHFSAIRCVDADARIDEDRVVFHGLSKESTEACKAELTQMFLFYHFASCSWDIPATLVHAPRLLQKKNKRVAADGFAYSLDEFIDFYGESEGISRWEVASR